MADTEEVATITAETAEAAADGAAGVAMEAEAVTKSVGNEFPCHSSSRSGFVKHDPEIQLK